MILLPSEIQPLSTPVDSVDARVDRVVVAGSAKMPAPGAVAKHEAGHAVAATLLGVEFTSVCAGSVGGRLLSPMGNDDSPGFYVRDMVVTVAGHVAEDGYGSNRATFASGDPHGDRLALATQERHFAGRFPDMQHRDVFTIANVVIHSREGRAAVDLVARHLQARGTLSASEVTGYVETAYRSCGEPAEIPDPALAGFCETWAVEPAAAEIVDLVPAT